MKFRQTLFWDTDPNLLDIKKNSSYIIEKMLNFGSEKDIAWMWKTYNKNAIQKVLKHSRSILPSTKKLWTQILGQSN